MKGIRIFVDNTHTTDNYAYLHNKNFNTHYSIVFLWTQVQILQLG